MNAIPFALVSVEDRSKIVAYGLDIDLPSGRDVVTFRREAGGQHTVSVHQSVERACDRYSVLTPLELVWEPDCRSCPTEPGITSRSESSPGKPVRDPRPPRSGQVRRPAP